MTRTMMAMSLFCAVSTLAAVERPGIAGLNELEQWLAGRGITVVSVAEPQPMIVNGTETGYKQFRGVVGLVMTVTQGGATGQGACTATLIDPEVLLTAGHCVYLKENGTLVLDGPADPSKIVVRNGANMFVGDVLANAKTIKKHDTWTGNISSWGDNVDMAVIHLDRKIYHLETYGIRDNPAETEGEMGKIVGYGITATGAFDSGIHRMGDAKLLDLNPYWGKDVIEVGDPSGSCQGDSGGPFLTTQNDAYVISGVTSFGGQTCYSNRDGYYTYVLPYRDWINTQVQTFTGHGLIETQSCGDADDVCAEGSEVDCGEQDPNFVPGVMAPCHEGCWGYDLTVCQEKPPVCGDEKVKDPEVCDGNTIDCASLGQYATGPASCNDTCDGWDESGCVATVCGDGKKEGNEFCDGGTTDCSTLGNYAEGTDAPCKEDCTYFDTTPCTEAPVVDADTATPDNSVTPDDTPVTDNGATDETANADTEENPDTVIVPDNGTPRKASGSSGCSLTVI
ncbi:MAG TPA: trypsin-like serine protease [bacterium]|nr:trypsin-like serine protease [bacterium]